MKAEGGRLRAEGGRIKAEEPALNGVKR